jgi:glycoside/pentoside/hexuronide:cation symporter, GPH family
VPPGKRLDRWTTVLYGTGAIAFGVKDNGFAFFLLLYYNQVLGLPEAWVGFGIMVALVLDGLIDPLVGYASDHLHSPWGRRHPLMYAAALPVAASYWLLWNPPAGLGQVELFAYFLVVAILVRLFIALYEIPSASLVPELTDQYDERTTILSYRYFFGWWGGLAMSILAYAVFLQPDAEHPVGVLNPDGYRHYGIAASIVMLVAVLVSAIGTHRFIPFLNRPPATRASGLAATFRELRETVTNRSFLMLFGAAVFASVAGGLSGALSIYFNTYFWNLTSTEISVLIFPIFLAAGLAGMLAAAVSRRWGKKWGAIIVSIAALNILPAPITLRLLGWFPANGAPALLPLLMVVNMIGLTLLIASSILFSSMIADVAEDSEVTTGRRSEGVFVAATMFIQKATSGVGIFASSLLLGVIGFPRGATPDAVDPEVIRMLGMVYIPVIGVLYLVSGVFLYGYRIDRATHEENLRRLAASRTQ